MRRPPSAPSARVEQRAERLAEAEVAGTSRARANLSRRAVAGLVAGVTAVAAISAGAFAAGALVGGDAGSVSALPAVSGSPLKPRKGQTRAGAIYAKASPAVVSIRTSDGLGHRLPHRQRRHDRDQRPRRRQLASRVIVRFGARRRADRRATCSGVDPSSDLAVLESSDSGSIPQDVKPLQFADSRQRRGRRHRHRDRQPARASTAPPPRASSPGSGARSRRPTTSRSTTSSRPTRRSTRATRAARCSTTPARVIGVNSQIATGRRQRQHRHRLRGAVEHGAPGRADARARARRSSAPTSACRPSPPSGAIPDGAEVSSVVSGGPADGGLNPRRRDRAHRRQAGPRPRGRREGRRDAQARRRGPIELRVERRHLADGQGHAWARAPARRELRQPARPARRCSRCRLLVVLYVGDAARAARARARVRHAARCSRR